MKKIKFHQYAWAVLAFTVLVVLFGAFVRATHAGAGCGNHWPDCNGAVVPFPHRIETLIEFTHRATSGIVFLMVSGLYIWAYGAFKRGELPRTASAWALGLTIVEALIGAGLVKFGLVEKDDSIARAVVLSLHLVNTFGLLSALTLGAWSSTTGRTLRLRGQGAVGSAVGFGLALTGVLAISGVVAALGDTLFPAGSLIEGLRHDLSPTAHFLVKLRVFHPLIAVGVGLYLVLTAGLVAHLRPSPGTARMARAVWMLLFAQMACGALNVLLLAPVSMQLVHLLLADVLWIALVLSAAEALAEDVPHVESASAPEPELGRAGWADYVALTKPRVISLLLFTTLAAMIIAASGWPGTLLFVAVAIGGYMSAGSANAINMVIDRDIDGRMNRTAKRPTVTQKIRSRDALVFAFALECLSFAILWGAANLLTAVLALAGLVCYVIVYTLFLKRRSWSNIVIGGAAGAFPPLVGWAAVTGDLSLLAWCLFAIIFVWTPVHFWALALILKEDYEKAGVPMLPVVVGDRATVVQIAWYTLVTVILSVMPSVMHEVGPIYFWAAALLNALLVVRCLQLLKRPNRPEAGSMFKYSMVYLFLLFLAMAVDRTV